MFTYPLRIIVPKPARILPLARATLGPTIIMPIDGADAKPSHVSLAGCWDAARKNLDAKEGCVEDIVLCGGNAARAAPRVASLRKHSLERNDARNAIVVGAGG